MSYTPTSTGTFSFTYKAVDQAGALSATAATATITVSGSEAINIAKSIYKVGNAGGGISARWTVSGTDSVKQGQTLTVSYTNGTFNAANGGGSCNGTLANAVANPKCVVGTAVVDSLGNYLYDKVLSPGGPTDPTDTTVWTSKPTSVTVFSSSPVLGGSKSNAITLK
ncbi:MAG TPA: hypothetical protein VFP36_10340 [Usitatibacter sp.]|nr:hypothetical protein [Usitatibacter sp.]